MDNNNIPQQPQDGQFTQQPQMQYTQQPQMQYQQPQMQYQQPQMQYQQPQMQYQQPQMQYQQPQMQYQQPQGQTAGQAAAKLVNNAKNVKSDFTKNFKKMGLSTWCLLGIIGAMLLIFAPFMNFASIHISEKYKEDGMNLRLKVADGLNMFELSKLSNTIDKDLKEYNKLVKKFEDMDYDEYDEYTEDFNDFSDEIADAARYGSKLDKDDLVDAIDDANDEIDDVADYIEDESDLKIKSTLKETLGTAKLVLKGKIALLLAPWFIIISGLGLLVFTVINNKKLKLVFSIVPMVFLVWLMICSCNFFSMMGIGVIALFAGIVLGIVSAVKDQPTYC